MAAYIRSNSVVSRVIAGETLIIPVRKGVGDLASIYSLNEVGSVIWRELERPCNIEQILQAIAAEFTAQPGEIDRDARRFLEEMCSAGLVVPEASGAAA